MGTLHYKGYTGSVENIVRKITASLVKSLV